MTSNMPMPAPNSRPTSSSGVRSASGAAGVSMVTWLLLDGMERRRRPSPPTPRWLRRCRSANPGRLHLLDDVRAPGRRLERAREVLGHLRQLAALELRDPDVADGDPVTVVDGRLDDASVALAAQAAERQLRRGAGRGAVHLVDPLDRLLAADPLAGLRPLLDDVVAGVLLHDLGHGGRVAAVRCGLERVDRGLVLVAHCATPS